MDHGALDILKQAILLEKKGQSFYSATAAQCKNQVVADFFKEMAEEEQNHTEVLTRQFKYFTETGKFSPESYQATPMDDFATLILQADLKAQISAAGFEGAAITAAMMMERDSVELYSQRAKASPFAEEKAMYQWLSDFEKGHLAMLEQIDRNLREAIWNDNQFWPY